MESRNLQQLDLSRTSKLNYVLIRILCKCSLRGIYALGVKLNRVVRDTIPQEIRLLHMILPLLTWAKPVHDQICRQLVRHIHIVISLLTVFIAIACEIREKSMKMQVK